MKNFNALLVLSFLLAATIAFWPGQGYSQSFVDTTAKDKAIVFEEFTGLNCPFCPDGHKIASQIKSNNDKVVLINIHTGGYARPRSGQPDFRSGFGSSIANQLNVRAYPNAAVNRVPYDGDKSFGRRNNNWQNAADQISGQSAPVNVAVQTSMDVQNREMTVNVEAYYTDSSQKGSTNKLNVALLQNDVPAYQAAASIFYPANLLKNGEYNHQHMLRELLTGQWGDDITSPGEGKLVSRTYTYKVPEKYGTIPVNLAKLEVAAFIAEGKENILNGTSKPVELNQANVADVAVTNASMVNNSCAGAITPAFTVNNQSDKSIDGFSAGFRLGSTIYERTFNKTISANGSVEITWPNELSLRNGSNTLKFEGIQDLNGGDLYDQTIENNFPELLTPIAFSEVGITNPFEAKFDQGIPEYIALDQSRNEAIGQVSDTDDPLGAKSSNGAIRQLVDPRFNSNSGEPGYIVMGKADLSNVENPYLSYYYTYSKGQRSVSNLPEITVEYSADCGENWQQLGKNKVTETNTFNPSGQRANVFTPSSADYQKAIMNLDELKEQGEVLMRLQLPGTDGNAIYVDEIQVGEDEQVGVSDPVQADLSAEVYPNPVSDQARVRLNLQQEQRLNLTLVNSLGQTVKQPTIQRYQAGETTLNLDVSNLSPGVYTLQLTNDDRVKPIKFIVAE